MKKKLLSAILAGILLAGCNVQTNTVPEVDVLPDEEAAINSALEQEIADRDKEIEQLKEQLERLQEDVAKAESEVQASSEVASMPEVAQPASSAPQQTSNAAPPQSSSAASASSQASSQVASSSTPQSSQASASSAASSKPSSSSASSSQTPQSTATPQVQINGNSATVKIEFGGGGSDNSKPTPDHAEIIALCKQVAEEMGLEWTGKPKSSFDPGITIDERTSVELREYLEITYAKFLDAGYVSVYAEIYQRHGFNHLRIYR